MPGPKTGVSRLGLMAASIFNSKRHLAIEVQELAQRRLACTKWEGEFGLEAYKAFETLRDWSKTNKIEVDIFGRPLAIGFHLAEPSKTALYDTKYLACVWIPDDPLGIHGSGEAHDGVSDGKIMTLQRLGGLHARTLYTDQSIQNTWTSALLMDKQIQQLPGHFIHDPNSPGFWEHYAPTSWDDLINGNIRWAWVGFRVNTKDGILHIHHDHDNDILENSLNH